MYEQIGKNKWKSGLLVFGFIVFVIGLGYLIGLVWGGTSHPEYAFIGLGIAFTIAMIMSFASYYKSDRVAISVSGARPVEEYMNDPNWRPLAIRFDNAVEGMSLASGLPKPKAYIIYDEAPNAFATGRNPEHSSIATTTGLLSMMTDQELQGVIGHEMSHIKNYDILLQTIVIVLVGTVILLSDIFLRTFWFAGDGGDSSGDGGALQLILMVIAIVLAILAPIIAVLIQLAISRKREYLADANGALLTRYPPGLASALGKIGTDTHQLRRANKAMAHLYIAQPLARGKGNRGRRMNSLFDTHPPIEDRIARLQEMAGSFQAVSPEEMAGAAAPTE